MAALGDAVRQGIRDYTMRRWGSKLAKADLRAAIDATGGNHAAKYTGIYYTNA